MGVSDLLNSRIPEEECFIMFVKKELTESLSLSFRLEIPQVRGQPQKKLTE